MGKMRQIVKKTKYNKVPIRNRDPGAAPCIIMKQEFGKIVNELNNFQNPTLIPIVMFDNESIEYSIEFVWIVKLRQDSHVGISLVYNTKKRRVEIKGIHTDKQLILDQHQLISAVYTDYSIRDFEFVSNINCLSIQ